MLICWQKKWKKKTKNKTNGWIHPFVCHCYVSSMWYSACWRYRSETELSQLLSDVSQQQSLVKKLGTIQTSNNCIFKVDTWSWHSESTTLKYAALKACLQSSFCLCNWWWAVMTTNVHKWANLLDMSVVSVIFKLLQFARQSFKNQKRTNFTGVADDICCLCKL